MKQKVVSLILARGGSKGVPHKNIRPLAGKPLIAYAIETARASEMIDRVIVSTNDEQIADIAQSFGAEVPFMRPAELAQDDSSSMDGIIHTVKWLNKNEGYLPEYVLLLQPTSPFRTTADINNAIDLALQKGADCVVSVTETPDHPYLTKQITEEGKLVDFIEKPCGYLYRQSFPSVYIVNGAIYLAKREVILINKTFYTDRTFAYVMPQEHSLDIDTLWDFYLANLILMDKKDE